MNKYKSRFEFRIAERLRNARIKFEYEGCRYPFIQPEKKRNYTPDFTLKESAIVIEAKGKFTKEDRDKMIWVREQHPELSIVLLFMNSDNKLRKGSKTTYADWAQANGFDWADFRKGIPDRWTKPKGKE